MELLEGEVFKPLNVEGYEKYLVSNKGRVSRNGKIRKPYYDRDGYNTMSMTVENKQKKMQVHRMVALTFLSDTHKEGLVVNHKDSDRKNNYVDNLEWVTAHENFLHGIKHGNVSFDRLRKQSKEANAKAVEKNSIPIEVYHKGIYTIYSSIKEASREIGVSVPTIKKLLDGKQTAVEGYEIEYI